MSVKFSQFLFSVGNTVLDWSKAWSGDEMHVTSFFVFSKPMCVRSLVLCVRSSKKETKRSLSTVLASTLKKPTRPCRITWALAELHPALWVRVRLVRSCKLCRFLQVYQADLLNDLDSGEAIDFKSVREHCQATDHVLRAPKQTVALLTVQ